MDKLRLPQVLPVLLKYDNDFKKGPYKKGNYRRVIIMYNGIGFNLNDIDKHREYLEKPYYVKQIFPYNNSCGHYNSEPYLNILLDKEEDKNV